MPIWCCSSWALVTLVFPDMKAPVYSLPTHLSKNGFVSVSVAFTNKQSNFYTHLTPCLASCAEARMEPEFKLFSQAVFVNSSLNFYFWALTTHFQSLNALQNLLKVCHYLLIQTACHNSIKTGQSICSYRLLYKILAPPQGMPEAESSKDSTHNNSTLISWCELVLRAKDKQKCVWAWLCVLPELILCLVCGHFDSV